jgi:cardiolipin synthase
MNLTIANQLTILRLCLVPVLVILVIYGEFGWGLTVFLLAAVTDALDGLFARLMKERTQLGTLLDPLADKLLVTSSLVVLSLPSELLLVRIPAWLTILAISRDLGIIMSALLIHLAVGQRVFRPTWLGKLTTAVQLSTILWVFWCNYRGSTGPLTQLLLVAMAVLTVGSGLHYIYFVRQIIGEEGGSGAAPEAGK